MRPTTDVLMQHAFINRNLDAKPIKDLLLEYKAEVVEEVVDDETEVSAPWKPMDPCAQHRTLVVQLLDVMIISTFSHLSNCSFFSLTRCRLKTQPNRTARYIILYVYLRFFSTILCYVLFCSAKMSQCLFLSFVCGYLEIIDIEA